MRYGIAFPYNHTRAIPGLCKLAEENGWDGCFLGDAIWCEDPMIGLAAAAGATSHIRLGVLVIPVPLRRPWKLASEALAVDLLSDGRLILGLATGAAWMGWYAFPDEPDGARQRAEMLEETIEILTRLFERKPFDYAGRHYHLKLTELDEMYYPPKPVQQPRIPLWTPGIWPRQRSMQRALKCDGVIVEKTKPDGQPDEVTPADVAEVKAFVEGQRGQNAPFDIVVVSVTADLERSQVQEKLLAMQEAGATWWVEGLWEGPEEKVAQRIKGGPLGL
jgi:hypothetical protein